MPIPLCLFSFGLDDWANVFAILTGLVAVFWFIHAACVRYIKRWELEKYLTKKWDDYRNKAEGGDGNYRHSIIHLMAHLGLTEDEVLQASFRSSIIIRELTEDKSGIADGILFQHKDAPKIKRTKPVRP